MQKAIAIFLFLFFPSLSCAEILFYEGAENGFPPSNRMSTSGVPAGGGDTSGTDPNVDFIEVSNEQKRNGDYSFKFYLGPRQSGVFNSYDQHCRLVLQASIGSNGKYLEYGKEYWMGLSIFFPNDFTPTDANAWFSAFGFHGSPDNPVGECDNWRNGVLDWQHKRDVPDIIDFPKIKAQSPKCVLDRVYTREVDFDTQFAALAKGQWHDYVLNFKLQHTVPQGADPEGFYKIWVNGVLRVEDTGINAFNDDNGPSVHFGPYSNAEDTGRMFFIDEIRIADGSSTYADVVPRDTTPGTDPPFRSNGAPIGTLASGTASTLMSLATDKNATCKFGTLAGQSYAEKPNTFTTTGAKTHSSTISGLSDGNTYTYYVRCSDGTNINPDDYVITYEVDDGFGGQSNLFASAIYVVGSDVNTYTDCYAAQYLIDGDTTAPGCNSTTGISGVPSINREYDLRVMHNLTAANLFGDALESWQCLTWSFFHKQIWSDSWSPAFTGANCNKNDWDNQPLSVVARYVRIEATGPAAGTQVREIVLHGTPVSTTGGGGARGTFSVSGARGAYSAGGMKVP